MARINFTLFLLFSYFCCSLCGKFNYFAYGSNLTQKRLKIKSPSAEFYSVAVLKDYRLDFDIYSTFWNGCASTIVAEPGESVTGVVWTLDEGDLGHLDQQEAVDEGWYFAKNVTVTTTSGEEMRVRTYEMVNKPPKTPPGTDLPFNRRPSNTYLEVLIFGAVESGLPSDYIGYLVSFPTNGKQAPDEIRNILGYPFGPK